MSSISSDMKLIFYIFILVVVVYAGYEFFRIRGLINVTKQLFAQTTPYENATGTYSILVLGDSTAVGVGASSSDDSIPGLLGKSLDASVENLGVSGAVTADVAAQLDKASRKHYDLLVIQIGANDVVSFHSLTQVADQMRTLLARAKTYSDHIVLLTGGRIGDAPLVPLLFRPLLNYRAATLRTSFMATAAQDGVAYVDLFGAPSDLYASDPQKYYAADGFHPSSAGYEILFGNVKQAITSQWPGAVYAK